MATLSLRESMAPVKEMHETSKQNLHDRAAENINAQRILTDAEKQVTGVLGLNIKEIRLDTG
jgi:hypothetical protein